MQATEVHPCRHFCVGEWTVTKYTYLSTVLNLSINFFGNVQLLEANVVLLTQLHFYSLLSSIASKSADELSFTKCDGLYAVFVTEEKPITVNYYSTCCQSSSKLLFLNSSI